MAEQTPREKTTYHVLKLTRPEVTATADATTKSVTSLEKWEIVARNIAATNADAAVKQHVEKQVESEGGMYVAVPARSWQPTSVKIETQTVVKLGAG